MSVIFNYIFIKIKQFFKIGNSFNIYFAFFAFNKFYTVIIFSFNELFLCMI